MQPKVIFQLALFIILGSLVIAGLSLSGFGCSGGPITVPALATNTNTLVVSQTQTFTPTPTGTFTGAFFIATPGISNLNPVAGSSLSITVIYDIPGTYTQPNFIVGITPASNTTLICPATNQYLLVDSTSGSNGTSPMTSTTQDSTDPSNGWAGIVVNATISNPYTQVWNVTIPSTLPAGSYNIVIEENAWAVGCSSGYGAGVPNTHRTITVSSSGSSPVPTSTATNTSTATLTSTLTSAPTSTSTPTLTVTASDTPSVSVTPTITSTTSLGIFTGPLGVSTLSPSPGSSLSVTVVYYLYNTYTQPNFIVGITPASNSTLVCPVTNQFLVIG